MGETEKFNIRVRPRERRVRIDRWWRYIWFKRATTSTPECVAYQRGVIDTRSNTSCHLSWHARRNYW
ncbi:hypothetical protein Y032_0091g2494 [Ancylostoma ceylanicum]|uniref:Uncharacterized protein n=1 Tax=Ancylostoma ceylanicum TaxID=53326 RepID=A0A016TLN1_9BILA|nr:hypothetical protein Y032_0091g2494 [Ancylostoma ceylanicum]